MSGPKFNWSSPRKDRTIGYPSDERRGGYRVPNREKVPAAILGKRKRIIRIDEATGAPLVEYVHDEELAIIGVRWMAELLISHFKAGELTASDLRFLEDVRAQPHRFVGTDRLIGWFGSVKCRSSADVRASQKQFEMAHPWVTDYVR